MWAFRFEHTCALRHGPVKLWVCPEIKDWANRKGVPNFGQSGRPPSRMQGHERCAVAADQWNQWISETFECLTEGGTGCKDYIAERYCHCRWVRQLKTYDASAWKIVAYWLSEEPWAEWRFSEDQIVFNPEDAEFIGVVTEEEVLAMIGVE